MKGAMLVLRGGVVKKTVVGQSGMRPTRLWVIVIVVPLSEAAVVANSITLRGGHNLDRSVVWVVVEMSLFPSTISSLAHRGLIVPG
jgi:hypothetical protein